MAGGGVGRGVNGDIIRQIFLSLTVHKLFFTTSPRFFYYCVKGGHAIIFLNPKIANPHILGLILQSQILNLRQSANRKAATFVRLIRKSQIRKFLWLFQSTNRK